MKQDQKERDLVRGRYLLPKRTEIEKFAREKERELQVHLWERREDQERNSKGEKKC